LYRPAPCATTAGTMRIAMVGTGYVGLVSGACFAEFGIHVTCVDTDAGKIARLKAGEIPIYEPGLKSVVDRQVSAGRLAFTTELAPAVAAADEIPYFCRSFGTLPCSMN